MLHIHVLLVAPLGASYMSEPGTDQHQSRIAIREAAHYSGAAADLPVEPFNDIVGADTSPVFAGITGMRFLRFSNFHQTSVRSYTRPMP